jgi:Fic-DOC domain mobile mystery protein B
MSLWPPIEGQTPIDDISGLKIPIEGVVTRKEISQYEFQNIAKAILKYLAAKPSKRMAPFNLKWCYKLHYEMFGDVWKWAGKPRGSEKSLGVKVYQIGPQLQDLMDDLACWGDRPLIEQAVELHWRAVRIHPFENGNGRWARLLANIWLKRHDHPLVDWPEPEMGREASEIRKEYLLAIKAADAGDLRPLIDLHSRHLAKG